MSPQPRALFFSSYSKCVDVFAFDGSFCNYVKPVSIRICLHNRHNADSLADLLTHKAEISEEAIDMYFGASWSHLERVTLVAVFSFRKQSGRFYDESQILPYFCIM